MGGRSKGCGAPQRHEWSVAQDQTCRPMTMQRAAVAKACNPCACVRACVACEVTGAWQGEPKRANGAHGLQQVQRGALVAMCRASRHLGRRTRARAHTECDAAGWRVECADVCLHCDRLERCASPRWQAARTPCGPCGCGGAPMLRAMLLAAQRVPCVLRSAARPVPCGCAACAAVGCAPRVHGIDFHPLCEDALRRRTAGWVHPPTPCCVCL